MKEFAAEIAVPLVQCLSVLVLVLVSMATNALRKKYATDTMKGVLDTVDAIAHDAVLEVKHNTVAALKEASEDGKLTADEVERVRAEAFAKIKQVMGTQGMKAAKHALGKSQEALDQLLEHKIEAKVSELREEHELITSVDAEQT